MKVFHNALGLVVLLAIEPALAQSTTEQVVYRKPLSATLSLLVVKGPIVKATALQDVLTPEVVRRTAGYTTVDVLLQPSDQPPLRVWGQRFPLYEPTDYDEFAILDSLLSNDQLILVISRPGSSISIVTISVGLQSPDRSFTFPGVDWSLLAAAIPAEPGRLGAKLSFNEKTKRLQVEVTDTLQETRQHTLFEQNGEIWQFTRVKRWEEKIPASNPSGALLDVKMEPGRPRRL